MNVVDWYIHNLPLLSKNQPSLLAIYTLCFEAVTTKILVRYFDLWIVMA